jgi:hypothetical protein
MTKQAAKMAIETESTIESPEEPAPADSAVRLSQHEIANLAYEFWVDRGCPHGSADEDWLRAERELRKRQLRTL